MHPFQQIKDRSLRCERKCSSRNSDLTLSPSCGGTNPSRPKGGPERMTIVEKVVRTRVDSFPGRTTLKKAAREQNHTQVS